MNDQPPVNVNVNQTPPQGVFVSLQDIYDAVTGTRAEMSGLRSDISRVLSTDADHEQRIRAVEQAQAYFVKKQSAMWAVGSLIALVVAVTGVLALIIH